MSNDNENKEIEFDPSECDGFYDNLEAALTLEENDEQALEKLLVDTGHQEMPVTESIPQENEVSFSKEEDLFLGVDAALTEQIENEFGKEPVKTAKPLPAWLEKLKLIPEWARYLAGTVVMLVMLVVYLNFIPSGQKLWQNICDGLERFAIEMLVDYGFGKMNVVPDSTPTPTLPPGVSGTPTPTPTEDPELTTTPEPTLPPGTTPTPVITPTPTPVNTSPVMDSDDVINILLLGEENVYNANYGRTDAILVGSINRKTGEIKLVSFLRDSYVSIPGHADNRLNSAYNSGGVDLLIATIEQNFKIDIDSYVIVDFDGFIEVIDKMGGLKISLTAGESEYLNTQGYISKVDERNTVAGMQNLTGSQVLGYCRIRKVSTLTKNGKYLTNDYGRTYRHRVVLEALFNKCMDMGLLSAVSLLNQCFTYVTVPENLRNIAVDCLQIVLDHKTTSIDTLQIPATKYLDDQVKVKGKDVIAWFPENIDLLQEFLYGTSNN